MGIPIRDLRMEVVLHVGNSKMVSAAEGTFHTQEHFEEVAVELAGRIWDKYFAHLEAEND